MMYSGFLQYPLDKTATGLMQAPCTGSIWNSTRRIVLIAGARANSAALVLPRRRAPCSWIGTCNSQCLGRLLGQLISADFGHILTYKGASASELNTDKFERRQETVNRSQKVLTLNHTAMERKGRSPRPTVPWSPSASLTMGSWQQSQFRR